MTKVWDPNRRVPRRAKTRKAPAPRKWDDRARRDAYVSIARKSAYFVNISGEERRVRVAMWLKRASKFYPLSERQLNGMIELMGVSFLVQEGYLKDEDGEEDYR